MKDEIGEYIEIYEVVGRYVHSCDSHESVVARATNEETAKKILKAVSRLKHQDDRSHRVYRAYSDKMLENHCKEIMKMDYDEFRSMVSIAYENNEYFYEEESNNIDKACQQSLVEMMEKRPTIFKTWGVDGAFEYKGFERFYLRVCKCYIAF